MNKKQLIALFLFIFLFVPETFAGANFTVKTQAPSYTVQGNSNVANLHGYALYVPAGVTCKAVLSQEINSESAYVGQPVNLVLTEDFLYDGHLIASSGSTISGTITQAVPAKRANKNAQIQVRFTTIKTPYNNTIPISATIVTEDASGILKAGTKTDTIKEYTKDGVVGAGAGAALGTALGALSGGSVGMGAVYGTAIGGGLGLVKGLMHEGGKIVIPANSELNVVFDQPITLGAQ